MEAVRIADFAGNARFSRLAQTFEQDGALWFSLSGVQCNNSAMIRAWRHWHQTRLEAGWLQPAKQGATSDRSGFGQDGRHRTSPHTYKQVEVSKTAAEGG
jgi:hypothetical protein